MHTPSIGQLKQKRQGRVVRVENASDCNLPCVGKSECRRAQEALSLTQDELRRLSAQLLAVEECERRRIALDLHDGLGQALCTIKHAIEDASKLLDSGATQAAADSLQQLIPRVQSTVGEVRRISMGLRPAILDDLGIMATLSWFFREFEGGCRDIKVEKAFRIQEDSVPNPLKITIFRILQEATSNVLKYAGADRIRVSLDKTDNVLHLNFFDNGKGFDLVESPSYCPLGRGLGLLSMKERARLSGGHCQITSEVGKGTQISVSWPLDSISAS